MVAIREEGSVDSLVIVSAKSWADSAHAQASLYGAARHEPGNASIMNFSLPFTEYNGGLPDPSKSFDYNVRQYVAEQIGLPVERVKLDGPNRAYDLLMFDLKL